MSSMTVLEIADSIERNLSKFGSVSVGPDEWKVIIDAMRRAGNPKQEYIHEQAKHTTNPQSVRSA
jgi:hypothetical protein